MTPDEITIGAVGMSTIEMLLLCTIEPSGISGEQSIKAFEHLFETVQLPLLALIVASSRVTRALELETLVLHEP